MARTYNIEIVHERKGHLAAALFVAGALALACSFGLASVALAQTGALDVVAAAFGQQSAATEAATQAAAQPTANATTQTSTQDWLTEKWNPADGLNLTAGSTIQKQPTVTNRSTQDYDSMQVFLQVRDTVTNRVLDPNNAEDAKRLQLILDAIWADPQGVIKNGSAYSTAQLQAMGNGVNNLYNAGQFAAGAYDTTAAATQDAPQGAYAFKYTGGANSAQGSAFNSADYATIFDHIVIPTNYTAEDLALMGDFTLVLWAQAKGEETPDPTPNPDPDPNPTPDPDPDPNPAPNPGANGNNNGNNNAANSTRTLSQTGDTATLFVLAAIAMAASCVAFAAGRRAHAKESKEWGNHAAR